MADFFNHLWEPVAYNDLQDSDQLRTGDLSKCQVAHTRERCVQLHNKTVLEARSTMVLHHSGAQHIPKMADIRYSVQKGHMTARRRKAPHASPAFAPQHDNERYELPRTTRTEHLSDAVARHIAETLRRKVSSPKRSPKDPPRMRKREPSGEDTHALSALVSTPTSLIISLTA